MAVRLHPDLFRQLAIYAPAALQEAGGITAPTLVLLHDYACHLAGYDPGTATMVRLKDAPDGWVFFGDTVVHDGAGGEEWYRLLATSDGVQVKLHKSLSGGYSVVPADPDELADSAEGFHVRQSARLGALLRDRELSFPIWH